MATLDIAMTLTRGASLHLIPEQVAGEELTRQLRTQKITHVQLPVPVMATLPPAALPDLQVMVAGGEVCSAELVGRWAGGRQFFNAYGPTEATVCATLMACRDDGKAPPIGRPIANTRIYILDAAHQLQPVGVPGELCIAGPGLARGYLNRPGLTREKFIDIQFPGKTQRIYKTGDRARWRPDEDGKPGTLEYLGRLDHQVKLRGYRIEPQEVAAALLRHPDVQDAVVMVRETAKIKQLTGFVVPGNSKPATEAVDTEETDNRSPASQAKQVAQWQGLFDDVYGRPPADEPRAGFNTVGWHSSYTKAPIPGDEMKVWLDHTVDRILSEPAAAGKVLEIGCGTGMLLFSIAPHCQHYTGVDFSTQALDAVRAQLYTWKFGHNVSLMQKAADDLDGLEDAAYDTVILNSVVQYFPSVDYLVKVLKAAVRVLAPGGCIFIGDVRNHALFKAFHLSVQLYRAEDNLPALELFQRVQENMRNEKELLVHPDFFSAFPSRTSGIDRALIQLKPGAVQNEMTCFRYDVTLYKGKGVSQKAGIPWTDWQKAPQSPATLRRLLEAERPDVIGFKGIPNGRLAAEMTLTQHPDVPGETVADLRQLISHNPDGVDPETFYSLTKDLPYTCITRYNGRFHFDVVLKHHTAALPVEYWTQDDASELSGHPWQWYTNQPVHGALPGHRLIPRLREFLEGRLPEYMRPSVLIPLASIPLTPNGKTDRNALERLAEARQASQAGTELPNTPEEEKLAHIWTEMLGREEISVTDHFFELGGHSLLATQLISRIRQGFGIEMPLRAVFDCPTLKAQAHWLTQHRHQTELPAILPLEKDVPLVLSFAQQRLWFLAQFENHGGVYNMPAILSLAGKTDRAALAQAMADLVDRHISLRMCFPSVQGKPGVRILPPYTPLSFTDLSQMPEKNRQNHLETLIHNCIRHRFDLTDGPLFTAHLIRLDAARHLLLLNMHHIISDGWSMGIFFRDLSAFYSAHRRGETAVLPELRVQYTDYAAWQRRWLARDVLERQLAYWQEKLAGAPEYLDLPADFPRPSTPDFKGGRLQFEVKAATTEALHHLTRQEEVTLFMALMSVFQVLLYRYTGQDDVLVGSPVANRSHHQTEDLIGFFVNTLVFRTRLNRELTWRELLRQVKQTALEAYAHQDVPFEALVEKLSPSRNLRFTPLFQVMFALQNTPAEDVDLPELNVSPAAQEFGTADTHRSKFDLTLNISEDLNIQDKTGLHCVLEYRRDLFSPDRIARMAGHFQALLKGLLSNPDQPIARTPMLGREEHRQLLSWGTPAVPAPDTAPDTVRTIIHRFEHQAARTPGRVALICDGPHKGQMTYGQLNRSANRLARHLKNTGIRKTALVGICLERSPELLVGLLAVLKSGAAYVPIDPETPPARLKFILKDSGVSLLLSQTHLQNGIHFPEKQVMCLDRIGDTIKELSPENPGNDISPDQPAYAIYTSGSTGKPKGVMIPHRALYNLMNWTGKTFSISEEDLLLQKTSIDFDASVWEFYTPLLAGGTLVLATPGGQRDPDYLTRLIHEYRITLLQVVPSQLDMLLQVPRFRGPTSLRCVFCGGETLTRSLRRDFFKAHQDTRLINLYGPTETTVDITYWDTDDTTPDNIIGRPVDNARIYILDNTHAPVPAGVTGELCIAGPQVSPGYINRPGLTRDNFIEADIFGRHQRIYKTGDLARWLPPTDHRPAVLSLQGRIDHQIKLRGFRIEPGEIESMLCRHEAVRDAAVVLRPDSQLVAFITMTSDIKDLQQTLRFWLTPRLPTYMIPSGIAAIDQLPLTASGKVDRPALLEKSMSVNLSANRGTVQPPVTETEQRLCDLWSRVLNVKIADTTVHFFEEGGHSLLATRLVSRIREYFTIDMPLQIIFEHPVLKEQATWIEQAERDGAQPRIPVLEKGDVPELSHAQQRLWFLAKFNGNDTMYNMPAVLSLEGNLDQEALQRAMTTLVRRHESLRTCFPEAEGNAVIRMLAPFDPNRYTDLADTPPSRRQEKTEAIIRDCFNVTFDLSTGPLFFTHLIRWDNARHFLIINMHHIISDGWSMGVLQREWRHLYTAYTRDEAPTLPPLPVQYTDYAAWEKARSTGQSEQLAYWKKKLAGAPEVLELPGDFPRPAEPSYRGDVLQTTLDCDTTQRLNTLARAQGATLYMTLLTVFFGLLHRYTGQNTILAGSPIANRNHRQTEDIIGFFVNTLVLRAGFKSDVNWIDMIQQVKQTALEAYANQDTPFETLVEALNPQRNTSVSPLFQVMFVLQNTPGESDAPQGLKIRPATRQFRTAALETAKFDLTLSITEDDTGLSCHWEFSTDIFKQDRIVKMAGHFRRLLEGMLENPAQPVSRTPMLPAEEARQLMAWGGMSSASPIPHQHQSIPALFEAQAAKTPAHIALAFEHTGPSDHAPQWQTMTYDTLNRKANQLAGYLHRRGFRANEPAGICMERSPEMIVAILGVLKAGGTYVPLDPDYPMERLGFMVDDSRISVLLTRGKFRGRFSKDGIDPEKLLCLDREKEEIASCPDNTPVKGHTHTGPAYIMYTSGSTGTPKGVCIPHRAVIRLVHRPDYIDFRETDRIAHASNTSFDAATFEIWGALLNGARLTGISKACLLHPEKLAEFLAAAEITTLFLTTALFNQISREAPDAFRGLRYVLFGGEKVTPRWVEYILSHKPPRHLLHVYGPTENTTFSTRQRVTSVKEDETIPIGSPIRGTLACVLDASRQPVPIGVPGELCLGGDGLATGYLGRDELTAEKFIETQVFGTSQRLYRTGDLVRWTADPTGEDGRLEFIGRLDNQVKFRGFRIEPGEIEAVLTQHETVKEAVVILDDTTYRLLAFVTLSPELDKHREKLPQRLRSWLKEGLPAHMIPTGLMVMDHMPLTRNGKTDRAALTADIVQPSKPTDGDAGRLPRTETEHLLCTIWSQVLGSENSDISTNFFEAGGHSLLALQLMSEIRKHFHKNLSPALLFRYPTPAELAPALTQASDNNPWAALVPMQTGSPERPRLFCLPGGAPSVYYLHLFAGSLGEDQPFYALQPPGFDGVSRPMPTVEKLAAYFIQALRQIQPEGPYLIAGHSAGGPTALEMGLQLQAQGQESVIFSLDAMPDLFQADNTFDNWSWETDLRAYVQEWAYLWEPKTDVTSADLQHLEGEALAEQALTLLKLAGMIPPGADTTLVKQIGRITAATIRPLINYRPGSRFRGRVVVIQASGQVPGQFNAQASPEMAERWQAVCDRPVDVCLVPGDHAGMMAEPDLQSWTSRFRAYLDRFSE
ncbi:MAG: amino acid adenylation domain-containing protein [Desulfobacterales bacterium]|nr:amino acid adenylation domain-containing protein [Desulfobacterales bacterium]